MTASLILAAGMGSRLRPLTDDKPKGLVPFLGTSLLQRQIATLQSCNITPIALVTGYRADKIEALGHPTFHNPLYDDTNMVESLFTARSFLQQAQDDVLISYGDIIYQKNNLQAVLDCEADIAVMIDEKWLDLWSVRNENPLNDAETLKMDGQGLITELGQNPQTIEEIEGQYTGLLKVSASKIADFIAFYDALDKEKSYDGRAFEQMYLTSFLQLLIDNGWQVKAAIVKNGWLEVDTVEDLSLYESLASEGKLNPLWQDNV